ncbi:MAG TPA: helix-turn-helix domain-containing protein [Desulfobacteraceae bacterium]|nr:helix-turn-helix domain-containing protein [Desulfobacteraceae bacterium]
MGWYGWKPYVPVAVRRARSLKKMEKLRKKGLCIQPVEIQGRKIARSFWGQAWCEHLEKFSDFENRLPRGRTYVRNGSVCHLEMAEGAIKAMVSGSELYNVEIEIKKLPTKKWRQVKDRCAGQIGSLLELLQGRLSESVMSVVTDRDRGLFPSPAEIKLHCSCPDWAVMCKHVAAVLYGVGARLDEEPELLFVLRGVDHEELITADLDMTAVSSAPSRDGHSRIAEGDLSDVFGIEMTNDDDATFSPPAKKKSVVPGKEKTDKPKKAPGPKKKARTAKKKKEGLKAERRPSKKKASPLPPAPGVITGETVVEIRTNLGMTKASFARALDVSPNTIANWERSKGPLNLQARTRKALANLSGTTPTS